MHNVAWTWSFVLGIIFPICLWSFCSFQKITNVTWKSKHWFKRIFGCEPNTLAKSTVFTWPRNLFTTNHSERLRGSIKWLNIRTKLLIFTMTTKNSLKCGFELLIFSFLQQCCIRLKVRALQNKYIQRKFSYQVQV
jgi:hypothetical protein